MAEPEEREQESENEEAISGSGSDATDPEVAAMLKELTPAKIRKLLKLADEPAGRESQEMSSLKEVAPGFKGDFINFTLKDTVYAEMVKESPGCSMEFPMVEIAPLKKVYPKDAAEVKASDESLALISKGLQVAIQYQLENLQSTHDGLDPALTDGIFCGLCLTAHAFSALQLERHTNAHWRGRISEATSGSQEPKIVQQIKKKFFRKGGGSPEAPPADEDDSESEPMVKQKRPEFKRKWWLSRRSRASLPPSKREEVYFYRPHVPGTPVRFHNRGRGHGRGRGRGAARPP
jgi:hypothetical protein